MIESGVIFKNHNTVLKLTLFLDIYALAIHIIMSDKSFLLMYTRN